MTNRCQQLRDYVHPKIGHIAAADVTPPDVVDIVEATAVKSLHVAHLAMVGIRMVFAHGIARHVVTANPCAHIRSDAIIGGAPDQRERVMLTDAEIGAVFKALPTMSRPNALMVRILLATGARIGELVQAEWVHLDFERAEWTIPPEHSKTKKGFVIPLPPIHAARSALNLPQSPGRAGCGRADCRAMPESLPWGDWWRPMTSMIT